MLSCVLWLCKLYNCCTTKCRAFDRTEVLYVTMPVVHRASDIARPITYLRDALCKAGLPRATILKGGT